MPDVVLVLGKLDLVRRALIVALEHGEILRHGVEHDDVDAITRGRWGLDNAIELVHQLAEEADRELPDWRPLHHHAAPACDGYTGPDPRQCEDCRMTAGVHSLDCRHSSLRRSQPDAHLGAIE